MFPVDMMFNILWKLPAKYLCRFKCVSNSLLGLINNKIFVKNYLSQRQSQIVFCGENLYYVHYNKNNINIVESEDLYLPMLFKSNAALLIGSCNGLLCIGSSAETFVYNPSTGEFRSIPLDRICMPDKEFVIWQVSHGFGYVESTEDYLIVKMYTDEKIEFLNIFSLRNGTWETIKYDQAWDTVDDENIFSEWENLEYLPTGVYSKGCINWVFDYKEEETTLRYKVVAFDLEKKKFRILYSGIRTNVLSEYKVAVMEDNICLLGNDGRGNSKFWVMEESYDGVLLEESWSKILVPSRFTILEILLKKNSEQSLICLCLGNDSHHPGKLVLLFNSEEKQVGTGNDIKLEAWPGVLDASNWYPNSNKLCLYQESVVSPN